MEFAVKNQRICRICMQDDVLLDWNGELFEYCGMSFKDCYYKYSHLVVIDPDPYPQYVCEACSLDLQNFHLFMEKAIETQKFLEQTYEYIVKEDVQSEEESKPETECVYLVDNCGNEWVEPMADLVDEDGEKKAVQIKSRKRGRKPLEKKISIKHYESDLEEDMELDEEVDFYEDMDPDDEDYIEMSSRSPIRKGKSRSVPEKKKARQVAAVPKNSRGRPMLSKQKSRGNASKKHAQKRKSGQNTDEVKINKNDPAMCSYCSKVVHNAYYLKRHEETHMENRERNVPCPKCDVRLYTKSALAEHMRTHDENRVKKYKCEFCEKAFYNRGACNVHRRIHLGQMVKCPECPKEYFRQIDLDRHMLSHSNDSSLLSNMFVHCEECGKQVRSKVFKEHQAIHKNEPQLRCTVCDKDFYSRTSCTKHMGKVHKRAAGKYDDIVEYYEGYSPRYSYLLMEMKKKKEGKS